MEKSSFRFNCDCRWYRWRAAELSHGDQHAGGVFNFLTLVLTLLASTYHRGIAGNLGMEVCPFFFAMESDKPLLALSGENGLYWDLLYVVWKNHCTRNSRSYLVQGLSIIACLSRIKLQWATKFQSLQSYWGFPFNQNNAGKLETLIISGFILDFSEQLKIRIP